MATDEALERLGRLPQQTLPEIHIHTTPKSDPPKGPVAKWLKVAIALGVPAILLEIVRRLLD